MTGSKRDGVRGRGTASEVDARYLDWRREAFDDGWDPGEAEPPPATTVTIEHPRTIISRNQSPDIPFEASINPYRGCEHGCSYCLSGDTPILMLDGTTRRLEDVKVGDEIYGTVREGWYRRYTTARVLAHWSVVKPAYRITLEDGTTLVAGPDHRFLTVDGWKFVGEAGQVGVCRPRLSAGMQLMGCGTSAASISNLAGQVVGTSAKLKVAGIEPLGHAQRLYDIQTDTEDFIANGVVSHNCYARPTHAYMDLSPGIDFETKLFAKPDAAKLLRKELAAPGYRCTPIALGANTDPYQPIEREYGITRSIIEVLHAHDHPLTIVTKSWRVERDIDLLADMAHRQLVQVFVSITSLDQELARRLEPRAAAPRRRIECVQTLSRAGIPVGVLFAPVIPFLNDDALEEVLESAAGAGASWAGYVIVRLPLEIRDLFMQWLEQHAPLKAQRVMGAIRDLRGGRDNDPQFFSRQRGQGVFANIIRSRFELACRRHGLNRGRLDLRTDLFHPPAPDRRQLTLF